MTLPDDQVKLFKRFSEDTFTMELDNESEAVKALAKAGYLRRHPGGPLGSRCSYYRTELGWDTWRKLKAEGRLDA